MKRESFNQKAGTVNEKKRFSIIFLWGFILVFFMFGTISNVCVAQNVGKDVEEQSRPDTSEDMDKEEGEVLHEGDAEVSEAFVEKAVVTDIHMKGVETLELPESLSEEARKLSATYVEVFCKNTFLRHEVEVYTQEMQVLKGLTEEGGALRRFLANMTILEDKDLPELSILSRQMGKTIVGGSNPALEDLSYAKKRLEEHVQHQRKSWQELRDTLVERQFLLFEIESNRHVVTQLASMMSVDKRWFWLFAVLAFGVLMMASFHERRHEIRRWLNGGKARQMGLSRILLYCFICLLSLTFITFIFGETIYRTMLDVTFSTTSPRLVCQHEIDAESALTKDLTQKNTEAKENQKHQNESWHTFAKKNIPGEMLRKDRSNPGEKTVLQQWDMWRDTVKQVYVYMNVLQDVSEQMEYDRQKLSELNGRLSAISGETLNFLRYKHMLRMMLGIFLAVITFIGISYFWAEVNRRRKHVYQACPHCLQEGFLKRWSQNQEVEGEPYKEVASEQDIFGVFAEGTPEPSKTVSAPLSKEEEKSSFVRCEYVISQSPYEECGYRFESSLRPLQKLSFPTLGIPQVGKTHWLTMLYWEIQNGYYPHLGFQNIPTSVTEEMERRVDEIMNARIGTAATQRDRIPQPLVLKYRDKDILGKTELLANIFDYSGEITTDTPLDDPRRKRALLSDGFFFFLDPIYPWQPQAEALKRFREDIQELLDMEEDDSLHLPIAICLTKIDLLPLVTTLKDPEAEAIQFYESLGQIDPTGVALNKKVIDARSELTDALRKRIWPEWDVEQQVKDLFGGRHKFFPLTPVGLDGAGERDLRLRTISPFGLVDPLAWLLEMSGYPTLK
ncbi:MAG: hypothetical protein Q4C96_04850 [Planctomycetia bacterium]|nr:hypothetical protein [Planctomycetia bacterium]